MSAGTKRYRQEGTDRFALFSCIDHPSQRFEGNLDELAHIGCVMVQRVERDQPDFYDGGVPVWRSGLSRAVLLSILESAKVGYLVVASGASAPEVFAAADFLCLVFKNGPPQDIGRDSRKVGLPCVHASRQQLAGEMHKLAERLVRWSKLSDFRPPSLLDMILNQDRSRKFIQRLDRPPDQVSRVYVRDSIQLSIESKAASFSHTRVVVQFVHPPPQFDVRPMVRGDLKKCPVYLVLAIGSFILEAFEALPAVDWPAAVYGLQVADRKRSLLGSGDFKTVRSAIKGKYHGDSMLWFHVNDGPHQNQRTDSNQVVIADAVFWVLSNCSKFATARPGEAPPAYEPAAGADPRHDLSVANRVFCQNAIAFILNNIATEPDLATLLSNDVADEDGVTTPARTELAAALSVRGCRVVRWRDDVAGGPNALAFPGYFCDPTVPSRPSPAVVLELV